MNKEIYKFGVFVLDVQQKQLQQNSVYIQLQPKVLEVLVLFLRRKGELISRDEIMAAVWGDVFVEESNLRLCIHSLRKALGKGFVQTVPKSGYRFVAEVEEIVEAADEHGHLNLEKGAEPTALRTNQVSRRFGRTRLILVIGFLTIFVLVLVFFLERESAQIPANALGVRTLAVLPFSLIGGDKPDFQAGLADALISNLDKLNGLRVLPVSSINRFVSQDFDPAAAGRELGADAVIEGSCRFEGGRVRVAVRLLNISTNETIWTETFEAEDSGQLALESLISVRISHLLSLKIADARDEQITGQTPNLNAEAVRDYHSARKIGRKGELFRREEMFGLYQNAISLEPEWALAYAGYAEALLSTGESGSERQRVESVVQKAITLDKSLAQVHAVMGEIYYHYDWDWARADQEFRKAIELNPDYAMSHHKYARFLMSQRRFSEAEEELKRAVEIEPFSPLFHAGFCELYSFTEDYDKAITACKYTRQIDPEFWQVPKLLFWIYVINDNYKELDELVLSKLSPAKKAGHPLTRALETNDLRLFWKNLINESSSINRNQSLVSLAMFHMEIGEKEQALALIEEAVRNRVLGLPLVNADSVFDPIRNEKRFRDAMREIGLPEVPSDLRR